MRKSGANNKRAAIAGAAAALAAVSAQAQDGRLSIGQAVRDRERPPYDAAGVKIGAFHAYPSMTSALTLNNNIYAVADDEQGDAIAVVEPNLRIQSLWRRHEISAEAGGRIRRFFDIPDENSNEYFSRLNVSLDFHDNVSAYGSANYSRLAESRANNSFNEGNAAFLTAEPITYSLAEINTGFAYSVNRFRLRADAHYSVFDFDDQPLIGGGVSNQDVRDHALAEFIGQADWAISPDTSLFIRGAVTRWDYSQAPPTAPLDRDSRGYEIAAGANFRLGNLAAGEVFAGYQAQTFADDPRLSDVGGVDYGASAEWYVSELTTVSLEIENDITPSTIADASSFTRRRFQLTADHELLRNLLVQAKISYGWDTFEDILRRDERFGAGARIDYMLNRRARLFADFSYTDQTSNAPVNSFDQRLFTLGVTLQL